MTEEDKVSRDLSRLQVLQNDMFCLIRGKRRSQHINMKDLKEEMKIKSVNQMATYHVLIETYDIRNHGTVGWCRVS